MNELVLEVKDLCLDCIPQGEHKNEFWAH
jgi:hypothetical protein